MSLPTSITASTNYDDAADDPKQARAQLAGLRGDVDTINAHLKMSPLLSPATPLTIGQGLESSGGALRAKLQSTPGLQRDANGIGLDLTALTAETAADDADLVVVHDDSAGARRKMTRANFLANVGAAEASQSEQEAGVSTANRVSSAVQHFHPSAAKIHASFNTSGVLQESDNVDSVTDSGTGDFTVNITDDFSSANYTVGVTLDVSSVSSPPSLTGHCEGKAAGAIDIAVIDSSETRNESRLNNVDVIAFGDL